MPGQPSRPSRIRWQIFALACGASFVLYLHRYTWNIFGPLLQADLKLSNTQLGFLFSLFYYTYATGQIPSGVVVDRFGPHRFLSVSIVAWSVAILAFGQTAWFAGLVLLRLLFGAAQAGCYPALTKVTLEWFPPARRTVLQGWIATTFGRAGGALSPIILGTLLMGWFGLSWQTALVALGLAGVAFGLLFWISFSNTPHEHPRVNQAERELIAKGRMPDAPRQGNVLPARRALKNRSLRWFVVQQFLDAGSDVAFVSLIGAYFLQARGLDIGKTGWMASLPLWGGAVGGIAGGWLNDRLIHRTQNRRWSRSGVGFVGKVIGCAALGIMVQQTDALAAAVALMAAKFFSDWSQPTVWGTCTDMGGRFSATLFSIINTAGTLGGVFMPIVFGLVLDWFTTSPSPGSADAVPVTNWGPLFYLLAGMYLGSGICWLMIDCTESLESPQTPENSSDTEDAR